ncbi:MAG: ketopantoate reductase family protein, partial [Anaerolineales bacterium]
PVQAAEEVALKTAANHSSMLQDVLRGAPTEIEAICGAIVKTAQKHGIDTPANWACWMLIRALGGKRIATERHTALAPKGRCQGRALRDA